MKYMILKGIEEVFILFKNNILLNILVYLSITLFMQIRLEEFGG